MDRNKDNGHNLKELTNYVREFSPLLKDYQEFLTNIDVISAKAKYAQSMNAILPEFSKERSMHLRDAYHPLLFLNNKFILFNTYYVRINMILFGCAQKRYNL